MPRAGSTARVKSLHQYRVEEAAEAVGVTHQTIRAWIKQGLPVLTAKRPTLILGWALKDFLSQARAKRHRPLQVGEVFCLRCKEPRPLALGLAEYAPISERHGKMRALCSHCEGVCFRFVALADVPKWREVCEVAATSAEQPKGTVEEALKS